MLSRLAFRNAQALSVAVRGIQTTAPSLSDVPRPTRLITPAPVRHGFIPEGWFTFFYPKTGVTGPYMFATALTTYLVSKEIYILEHEFYNGISLFIICVVVAKKFGPQIGAALDKSVDECEANLNRSREMELESHENTIKELELEKWRTDAQKMIYEVKKQNVLMQLEATYRERMIEVYNEVKKRLDFHAQIDTIERRLAQKQMVQWVINSVLQSITPEQEKATLQQCIKDLETLAVKA